MMAPAEDEDETVDWAGYSSYSRYTQASDDHGSEQRKSPTEETNDPNENAPDSNENDIDELSDMLQVLD
ncbi:hypothetical protein IWW50_001694 [Coemansia erecta]|nr:hypothetical protein IWW50_001694 [Coemansia erecta]